MSHILFEYRTALCGWKALWPRFNDRMFFNSLMDLSVCLPFVCVCVVGSRLPAAQVTGQTGHASENTLFLLLVQNGQSTWAREHFSTAEPLSDTQTEGLWGARLGKSTAEGRKTPGPISSWAGKQECEHWTECDAQLAWVGGTAF